MTEKNTKKAGFSLVELIFAIFFVSFIIFGVIKLQTSNLTLSNTQNNTLQANLLAGQGLEIVAAMGYAGIVCASPPCTEYLSYNDGTKTYSLGAIPETGLNGLFDRSIIIETDPGLPGAYKVTSRIEWTDSSGDHRQVVDGATVNGQVEAKRIIY